MNSPASLTLVLGGVASGKSRFAEELLNVSGLDRVYVATAEAHDAEMSAKISMHRARRDAGWSTIEEPLNLPKVLEERRAGEIVLLDCATLWLSNLMMAKKDMPSATTDLIAALQACAAPVVIVSNEVGLGGIADTALGRRFQREQGGLNKSLAEVSEVVIMVTAGLPLALKGALP